MTFVWGKLARAGLVFAAALLVLAGGLFAAGAAFEQTVLGGRYIRALELAAHSLEAPRSVARVRRQLARMADSGAPIEEELQQLEVSLGDLSASLAALRQTGDVSFADSPLAQAEQAASRLSALAIKAGAAAGGVDRVASRNEFLRDGQQHLAQVDAALTDFSVALRGELDEAARQVRRDDRIARDSMFAAGALALALGLLLTLVAWRSLSANARLMVQLNQMAREDGLTGVANRRTLDERLPQEMARASRQKFPLSVVMIDLDHFKRFNDRRGHAAGDALLRNAAQAWLRQLRPTDLLARYGGEEFTLVLPACDEAQAEHMVERLQPLTPERQTFSAGIATWNGHDSQRELLAAADRALLQAKRGGRNRIVVSGREPQISLPLRLAT
jgi:diguanylate cyclase (GGDEF)-like protein